MTAGGTGRGRRGRTGLVRPLVETLHGYTPGEQPKIPGLIKLNTNENPYPPSPEVLRAVRKATDARLRLYPDPSASGLRAVLARHHACDPANIIVGNGSDELLALATRAFVEPARGAGHPRESGSTIQFFDPSYSLYPVLAGIHGASVLRIPLTSDFNLPTPSALRRGPACDLHAALTFVTTPNAPSGRGYPTLTLRRLCGLLSGVVILDEAYVDFAGEHALSLALEFPHVLVARTFSKAYSLCFQRVGYMVGHPALISALDKIRDSYNVNGLGQIAALATLSDLPYYRRRQLQVVESRNWLAAQLTSMGFHCLPSSTNFILTRPPTRTAKDWLDVLRERRILVRWFDHPSVRDYLRITIGDTAQTRTLVATVRRLLK